MEITGYRQDYHRNGIGGEGSTVAFFYVRDGRQFEQPTPFMAVLWGDRDGEPTECMVLSLLDVAPVVSDYVDGRAPDAVSDWNPGKVEHFRYLGAWRSTDHFLPHLLPCLREARQAWRETVTKMHAAASQTDGNLP